MGKGSESDDRIRLKREGRMNNTLLTMHVASMISILAREDTGELGNTIGITEMGTLKSSVVIVDVVPSITFIIQSHICLLILQIYLDMLEQNCWLSAI